MPWLRLNNFEYAGYTADIEAHLLPPNALSFLGNAHTKDGSVERYNGYIGVYTPAEVPLWLLAGGFNTPQILAANTASITNLSTGVDISPSTGLIPVEQGAWTGGVMHGLFVLNNGKDYPVYWSENATITEILPNWPVNTICGTIRPFKNYLFAGNIREVEALPTVVMWSSQTNPGEVPASWDYTDPTNDSGRFTLSDTPGKVVDFLAANDSLFCYKEDAVYEITPINGVFIFKFAPRFTQFGTFAPNCSINHRGLSFVFGNDDIVSHNSTEMRSIVSSTLRRRIFNKLSPAYFRRSFVSFDPLNQELMFCTPWNSEYPDHAFTYRPETQKWGERDLPQCSHIITGKAVFSGAAEVWNASVDTWDTNTRIWNENIVADAQTVASVVSPQEIVVLNQSYTHKTDFVTVHIERIAIDFGTEKAPNERIKFIDRLRPHIITLDGEQCLIAVGTQMNLADPIVWHPQIFTKGVDRDIAFRVNGRYISWHIVYVGGQDFKLESLDIEFRLGAMW